MRSGFLTSHESPQRCAQHLEGYMDEHEPALGVRSYLCVNILGQAGRSGTVKDDCGRQIHTECRSKAGAQLNRPQ